MAILPEVTAVLLPQNSVDKCPVGNMLVEGRLEMAVLPAVTAVLWKHGMTALMLVQIRGKVAFMPAVTAVLLHPSITTQAEQYITMS